MALVVSSFLSKSQFSMVHINLDRKDEWLIHNFITLVKNVSELKDGRKWAKCNAIKQVSAKQYVSLSFFLRCIKCQSLQMQLWVHLLDSCLHESAAQMTTKQLKKKWPTAWHTCPCLPSWSDENHHGETQLPSHGCYGHCSTSTGTEKWKDMKFFMNVKT